MFHLILINETPAHSFILKKGVKVLQLMHANDFTLIGNMFIKPIFFLFFCFNFCNE